MRRRKKRKEDEIFPFRTNVVIYMTAERVKIDREKI